MIALVKIFIFPGMIFMIAYGLVLEFIDRKVYARFQNRIGPPWYQPLADILKLIGKETIIPKGAKAARFGMLPCIGLASVRVAFL